MGILDFFKKKEKPVEREKPVVEIRLDKLDAFIKEERGRRLEPFVEKSLGICKGIVDDFNSVISTIEGVKTAKPVGQWSKIGENMRDNFVQRTPPVLKIMASGKDFEAVESFYASAVLAVNQSGKIVADNRYLFHFFPEKMGEFGSTMNKAALLLEELGRVIRDARNASTGFDEALKTMRDYYSLVDEKKAVERELTSLDGALREESKKMLLENKAPAASVGVEEVEKKISALKTELSDMFNHLDRPLRKLEKITLDKKLAKTADFYASSPADAALKGNLEELEWLVRDLGKELAAGRIESDEKKRERAASNMERINFNKARELVSRVHGLEKELTVAVGAREKERASDREKKEEEEKLAALGRKRMELWKKSGELEKKTLETLAAVENMASRATGSVIKIIAK